MDWLYGTICKLFQSTPSAWRETTFAILFFARQDISIHSLRMEGDDHSKQIQAIEKHFNPLPPHGGRPKKSMCGMIRQIYFNPLPPHGGRRTASSPFRGACNISIHSLRMEGDRIGLARQCSVPYFNPLPPHGGRRGQACAAEAAAEFQSTPSAWRETGMGRPRQADSEFQSTPSAWRETASSTSSSSSLAVFQSTPSAWRETAVNGAVFV